MRQVIISVSTAVVNKLGDVVFLNNSSAWHSLEFDNTWVFFLGSELHNT